MKAIKIVAIASIALNLSIIGGTIGAYFYLRTPAAQEKIKKAFQKIIYQRQQAEHQSKENFLMIKLLLY